MSFRDLKESQPPVLPEYRCTCGFVSHRDQGFQRHLTRARGGNHARAGPVEPVGCDDAGPSCSQEGAGAPQERHSQAPPRTSAFDVTGAGFARGHAGAETQREVRRVWVKVPSPTQPCRFASAPAHSEAGPQPAGAAGEAATSTSPMSVSTETSDAWGAVEGILSSDIAVNAPREGKQWQMPSPSAAARVAALAFANQLAAMRDAAVASSTPVEAWASPQGSGGAPDFPVEAVEAVLTWQNPLLTAKVFGAGLYALICCHHLAHGVEVLQPSTAAAGLLLLYTVAQCVAASWRRHRPNSAPQRQLSLAAVAEEEATQQRAAEAFFLAAARSMAPLAGALAGAVRRHLSGQDTVATLWLAVTLWLYMCLGESRLLSQAHMGIVAWAALFSLPPAYAQSRRALHALTQDLLDFALAVIDGGERVTLGVVAASGVVTFAILGGSIFLRLSLALIAALAVLVWRSTGVSAK